MAAVDWAILSSLPLAQGRPAHEVLCMSLHGFHNGRRRLAKQGAITMNGTSLDWGPAGQDLRALAKAVRQARWQSPAGGTCIFAAGLESAWLLPRSRNLPGYQTKHNLTFRGSRRLTELDWLLLECRQGLSDPESPAPSHPALVNRLAKRVSAGLLATESCEAFFQFYGCSQLLTEVRRLSTMPGFRPDQDAISKLVPAQTTAGLSVLQSAKNVYRRLSQDYAEKMAASPPAKPASNRAASMMREEALVLIAKAKVVVKEDAVFWRGKRFTAVQLVTVVILRQHFGLKRREMALYLQSEPALKSALGLDVVLNWWLIGDIERRLGPIRIQVLVDEVRQASAF